jgi:peroxiredoxin Q/BCP
MMITTEKKLKTGFRLKIVQGEEEKEIRFKELLTRPTIVSVYMRNNTPGCDRQNDSLVEHVEEFDQMGYNLVALSRDTCGSHRK